MRIIEVLQSIKKIVEQKRNPLSIAALIILLIFLFDFLLRHVYLLNELHGKDLFFYIFSGLFEFLFLSTLFASRLKNFFIVPLFIIYFFLIAGSYGFYTFFNTLPGINTFAYIILTPANSYTLVADSLSVTNFSIITLVICVASIGIIFLRKKLIPIEKKYRVGMFLILAVFALVLNNNTKLADNRTLPFSNAIFSAIHGYSASQAEGSLTKLGFRTYHSKKKNPIARFDKNVLFIMSESINPFILKEYGYTQQFMPKTSQYLKDNSAIIFKKMFSNSTITAVSVPFAFAGLNPVEGREKLLSSPMIYDLIKENYSNVKTALISSWSYDDYPKFKDFFSSASLDYFIYREKIDAEKVCDMGGDDSLIANHLSKFISKLKSGENFFSMLHFSNTHFPYFSKTGSARNLPTKISNDYANSLATFDDNLSAVFEVLFKNNRLSNTLIFFTSDHSEQLGLFGDGFGHYGKFSVWNCAVPSWCIFPKESLDESVANNLSANSVSNTSNNDIIPTICDFMNIGFGSYYGNSLISKLPDKRKIFIYNGLGENRTDNKDYVGIICEDEFFVGTKAGGELFFDSYAISDLKQKINLIQKSYNRKEFSGFASKLLLGKNHMKK